MKNRALDVIGKKEDNIIMENIQELLEQLSKNINSIANEITLTFNSELSDALRKINEQFLLIDLDDIKNTELFENLNKINPRKAIHKEDIQWIIQDYDTLDEVLYDFEQEVAFLNNDLSDYIRNIVLDETMRKREKVVVLLSHMESLIMLCLGNNLKNGKGIKEKVSNAIRPRLSLVNEENVARIYILAITNIIFAKTDEFETDIDKRLPFRNYILHNGICGYGDENIEEMYFILVSMITVLLISAWVINKEVIL